MADHSWLDQLHCLDHLANDLALLPVGWGTGGKGPMLTGWQHHTGHTIEALRQWPGIRSVGARTGLLTGPLLAFDFDGESSLSLGLYPWTATTWQVHRNNDPFRLKVLFRPTPEQIAQLPQQSSGSVEFQGKTLTADPTPATKGEALEVFFDGGRQVVLLGHHPSTGGHYFWPDGLGPETLSPPPDDWWAHALHSARNCQQRITTANTANPRRRTGSRLNPCPICGRHSGANGSGLWCSKTVDGLILCMPGSTFSAEQTHGPLVLGQVLNNGWALVKRTPIAEGDVLTFRQHQHRTASTPSPRSYRPRRPQRPFRIPAAGGTL